MDLSKFKEAFERMNYDNKSSVKTALPGLRSSIIITESSDIDSASNLISYQLDAIKEIFVQESISEKFIKLLKDKIKIDGSGDSEIQKFAQKGFEVIGNRIVKCPSNLIGDNQTAISLDVFRTSKEGISLAKAAQSVNLWCQNIGIAFEYINGLPNAYQIWVNSSHGNCHPKIPFIVNGKVIYEDGIDGKTGSLIEVAANAQFQTTFHGEKFKTVVVPFGETFAN